MSESDRGANCKCLFWNVFGNGFCTTSRVNYDDFMPSSQPSSLRSSVVSLMDGINRLRDRAALAMEGKQRLAQELEDLGDKTQLML